MEVIILKRLWSRFRLLGLTVSSQWLRTWRCTCMRTTSIDHWIHSQCVAQNMRLHVQRVICDGWVSVLSNGRSYRLRCHQTRSITLSSQEKDQPSFLWHHNNHSTLAWNARTFVVGGYFVPSSIAVRMHTSCKLWHIYPHPWSAFAQHHCKQMHQYICHSYFFVSTSSCYGVIAQNYREYGDGLSSWFTS